MQTVTFYASQVELAQAQPNDIYMSVQMRMFSTRPNRNGFAVSEAFIDNIAANSGKYTCLPQCADAYRLRRGDTTGLTHMLDRESGQFQSEQIGSFFSFAKATDEFGASLIGEARIPKRDPRLCETLLRMYQAGTLAFSFEIQVSEITEADGVAMIDAAEGNELIGMAVVSTPAYPEATALALVAEDGGENTKIRQGEDEQAMNEDQKKIAELEARLMLAEQKSENDEELRKKEEELEEEKRGREQAEAAQAQAREAILQYEAQIAELEGQVEELKPFKAEAEQLRADKAAAELAAKQQELTRFAEAQGLDVQMEAVAEAIQKADYAALVAEALRVEKPAPRPVVAAYAMGAGIAAKGEYEDLLGRD